MQATICHILPTEVNSKYKDNGSKLQSKPYGR